MRPVLDNAAESIFLRFSTISCSRSNAYIVSPHTSNHKWRSSFNPDDKCHLENQHINNNFRWNRKLRTRKTRNLLENKSGCPAFIGGGTIQGGDRCLV
jgi:hypothetical protein